MSQKAPRPAARNEPNRAGSEYLGGSSEPRIATTKINIKPNSASASSIRFRTRYVHAQNSGAERLANAMYEKLVMALTIDGARAFDCPKTSAAFHESGHCVISALQGHTPSKASIWSVIEFGRPQWIGRTDGIPKWTVNDSTPPENDLKQAQSQLAGVVSEALFDPNYRLGALYGWPYHCGVGAEIS